MNLPWLRPCNHTRPASAARLGWQAAPPTTTRLPVVQNRPPQMKTKTPVLKPKRGPASRGPHPLESGLRRHRTAAASHRPSSSRTRVSIWRWPTARQANFSTTEGYIRRGRNKADLGERFPALPDNVVRLPSVPRTVPSTVPQTGTGAGSACSLDQLDWRPQRDSHRQLKLLRSTPSRW